MSNLFQQNYVVIINFRIVIRGKGIPAHGYHCRNPKQNQCSTSKLCQCVSGVFILILGHLQWPFYLALSRRHDNEHTNQALHTGYNVHSHGLWV